MLHRLHALALHPSTSISHQNLISFEQTNYYICKYLRTVFKFVCLFYCKKRSFQVDACRFHFCFYCCTYNQTTQRSLSKQLSVKLRFLVDLRNLYGTSTINQVHLYKSYRIKKYCRGLVYNRLSLEARGSASYGSDCLH